VRLRASRPQLKRGPLGGWRAQKEKFLQTSSGWIIGLCIVAGAAAGWHWGSSEVASITAALRARGELGDQYPIIAPMTTLFGVSAGVLIGFVIIGVRRLLRRGPAA